MKVAGIIRHTVVSPTIAIDITPPDAVLGETVNGVSDLSNGPKGRRCGVRAVSLIYRCIRRAIWGHADEIVVTVRYFAKS